jgi:hypothetical protein
MIIMYTYDSDNPRENVKVRTGEASFYMKRRREVVGGCPEPVPR